MFPATGHHRLLSSSGCKAEQLCAQESGNRRDSGLDQCLDSVALPPPDRLPQRAGFYSAVFDPIARVARRGQSSFKVPEALFEALSHQSMLAISLKEVLHHLVVHQA